MITGIVTDINGGPLDDVALNIVDAEGPYPEITSLTNKLGKYSINNLVSGKHTIRAEKEHYNSTTKDVTVKDEVVRLDFILQKKNEVSLSTDKSLYSISDSIKFIFSNNSNTIMNSDFNILLHNKTTNSRFILTINKSVLKPKEIFTISDRIKNISFFKPGEHHAFLYYFPHGETNKMNTSTIFFIR